MSIDSPMTPDNILAAARSIEDELPDIFGTDWEEIGPEFRNRLAAVESTEGKEQHLAALNLVRLFAEHGKAFRERFKEEILRQDEIGDTLYLMAESIEDTKPDIAQILRVAAEPASGVRKAVLKAPDKAKSFKLANLEFDLGEMHALGYGILAALGDHVLDSEATPFVVALGILAIAGKIIDELKVEFDEREATVLWGFAETADEPDRQASEKDILGITNAARQRIGLTDLDENELRNALHKLEQLKVVQQVEEETWRIVESIRRK